MPDLPAMFATTPTLDQLTGAVYKNSAMIRSISGDDVTIKVPDVPVPIKATLRVERPKRIRLVGGVSTLTGREIDFGANDELFWIGIKKAQQTYYCRNDQFATCPVRQMVPIDPAWVLEALGMIDVSPNESHDGPFPVDGESVMFVTQRTTPAGTVMKKTTIHAKTGCILRQEIYSPNGTLAAVAVSSNHAYDGPTGILYARHIELQCQGSPGVLTIDLNDAKFNVPINPAEFVKPVFPGYTEIDICSPGFINSLGTVPPTAAVYYESPTGLTIPTATALATQPVTGAPTATPYPYRNLQYDGTVTADQSQTVGGATSTEVR